MQSLKSTAFAVTLLAISAGLYFVSSDTTAPEMETPDHLKIQIEDNFSTSQGSLQSGSLLPNSISNVAPPIQVSTNITPPQFNSGNAVTLPAPQLPKLQMPDLNSSFSANKPLTNAPTLSQSAPVLSSPGQLKLPEIATRQPVNNSPNLRDDGLIDALNTNDFNGGNTTLPVSTESDKSYNSLAGAFDKEEDSKSVKSADGSLGSLDMPDFGDNAPAKPAPVSIAGVWAEVDRLVAADEYRGALGVLSKHYGKKGLTGPQKQKLQGWLDALAGKVIYSTEHLFVKQPHVVQPGESLDSIARQFNIPAEVVYNINRGQFIGTNEVRPGMELKVINGPFHAEVDLEKKMMTLFVKNLYAGRFPVAIGISGNPDVGNFDVKVKSPEGFTWRDASGKEYPAGSPGNGYGPYWMGLSGSLCIHAVPPGTPQGHRGCIGLGEKDARDVYGILSKNSQISIVR